MAVQRTFSDDIDNIATTTWGIIKRDIIGNVFEKRPLTSKLVESGRITEQEQGGRFIEIPVLHTGGTPEGAGASHIAAASGGFGAIVGHDHVPFEFAASVGVAVES